MSDDELRAEFHPAEPGSTFLAFGVHTASMLAMSVGEAPRPIVQLSLTGKWNHAAEDKLQVILPPDLAEEVARYLTEAAAAARRDVRTYLRKGHV